MEAARNHGIPHSKETKLLISRRTSSGSIYIYDEFKKLLIIDPSLRSVAILLGSSCISISSLFL